MSKDFDQFAKEIREIAGDGWDGVNVAEELKRIRGEDVVEQLQSRVAELEAKLKDYQQKLDARWREGTRIDAYARGMQDGLEAAEVLFEEVFRVKHETT